MKKGYKICPHCWKEIKSIAIKCQYCLKFLDEEQKRTTKECPFCMNEININESTCPYCDETLKRHLSLNKKHLKYYIVLGLVMVIIIILSFFIKNKKLKYENNIIEVPVKSGVDFEKKEKCLSYKTIYLTSLTNQFKKNWYTISSFNIFYNWDYDTCIVSYITDNLIGDLYTRGYSIIDYLNWEKDIYYCAHYNWTDYNHSIDSENEESDDPTFCIIKRNEKLNQLKN